MLITREFNDNGISCDECGKSVKTAYEIRGNTNLEPNECLIFCKICKDRLITGKLPIRDNKKDAKISEGSSSSNTNL